jgi:hypothetical protein
MTLSALTDALRKKRSDDTGKKKKNPDIPDEKLIEIYTRCSQCGKALFMDDRLIVDQATSPEKFLARCNDRLLEHRCNSGSRPQH